MSQNCTFALGWVRLLRLCSPHTSASEKVQHQLAVLAYSADMAQNERPKKEVSPVGRRLARYRKRANLTAEQLAERIPNPDITRGVIANIESGRKRDLTSTELALIASGLDVSPIALLVDMNDPFAVVDIPGLADGYRGLTNTEYVFATSIQTPEQLDVGIQLPTGARILMGALLDAEGSLEHLDAIDAARSDRAAFDAAAASDPQNVARYVVAPFHRFGVREAQLDGEMYRAYMQDLVDDYRDLLQRVPGGMWSGLDEPLPPSIEDRIERVRRRVVQVIEADPTLDRSASRRLASEDPRRIAREIHGPIIDESGTPVGTNYRTKTFVADDGEKYRLVYREGDPDVDDLDGEVEEYRGD